MFSTQADNCIPICPYFAIISIFAAELKEPRIGIWGKGLMVGEMSPFLAQLGSVSFLAHKGIFEVILYSHSVVIMISV